MVVEEARAKGHLYKQWKAQSRTKVFRVYKEDEDCAGQALMTESIWF